MKCEWDKVIFLDHDGVLNGEPTVDRITPEEGAIRSRPFGHPGLEPHLVARLNEIIRRTGAAVVFSTTWREHYEIEKLLEFLGRRGFQGVAVGRTPSVSLYARKYGTQRHHEIMKWLQDNGTPDRFVVLDDDETNFGYRHVRTDPKVGLTEKDVEDAVRILNEGA